MKKPRNLWKLANSSLQLKIKVGFIFDRGSYFCVLLDFHVAGILECVLPELNIEELHLLAVLLDRNSKHAGQVQILPNEMHMHNSDGAGSCKTDFFEPRKF